jgi:hypothetical protein
LFHGVFHELVVFHGAFHGVLHELVVFHALFHGVFHELVVFHGVLVPQNGVFHALFHGVLAPKRPFHALEVFGVQPLQKPAKGFEKTLPLVQQSAVFGPGQLPQALKGDHPAGIWLYMWDSVGAEAPIWRSHWTLQGTPRDVGNRRAHTATSAKALKSRSKP